jgi:hypothetical protein
MPSWFPWGPEPRHAPAFAAGRSRSLVHDTDAAQLASASGRPLPSRAAPRSPEVPTDTWSSRFATCVGGISDGRTILLFFADWLARRAQSHPLARFKS